MADIGTRIEQYIKLRDLINEKKKQQKEVLKPLEETLEKLNSVILAHLNAVGVDSVAAKGVGTAFKSFKKSATIADPAVFRRYVIDNGKWDLVDWKANANAVEAYIKELAEVHSADPTQPAPSAPPGINFGTFVEASVRRSS